jgi:protein-L-isoaspartate(D-aspartate) O-methyltransferase
VTDARIIRAMEKVRRADFLPETVRAREYEDRPLPIGHGQTTSQPSLIALMIEALKLRPGCNVLEVGTGSGYQTALLAELCAKVSSIDIVAPLAVRAQTRLRELGYANTDVRAGDGYLGWPDHAPFDGIVVSAGAAKVPAPLVQQLKTGGRLVVPVGGAGMLRLQIVTRQADGGYTSEDWLPVSFVPLIGEHADRDRR